MRMCAVSGVCNVAIEPPSKRASPLAKVGLEWLVRPQVADAQR